MDVDSGNLLFHKHLLMKPTSEHIKNQLRNSDTDSDSDKDVDIFQRDPLGEKPKRKGRPLRNLVVVGLIVLFGYTLVKDSNSLNPFSWFSNIELSQPSEDLLNRMNIRMVEMGYTGLNRDQLIQLRRDGVTATYISNIRALGYTDLTLEQSVSLAKAGVTSTFVAMMIELGYTMTVEEILTLRSAGVTAHFTSNLHDLGYRDMTIDQLVRTRRIGVTPELVRRLQNERGPDIPMEDIIRYRISNQ